MNLISSLLLNPMQIAELRQVNIASLKQKASKKNKRKQAMKETVDIWESVLLYLVFPNEFGGNTISATTKELFQHVGLSKFFCNFRTFSIAFSVLVGDDNEISQQGFHFLMLNRVEQVWTYIIHYLRY